MIELILRETDFSNENKIIEYKVGNGEYDSSIDIFELSQVFKSLLYTTGYSVENINELFSDDVLDDDINYQDYEE